MFEVGETYANRRGKYTVLSIDPPKMTVRYEDGEMAHLNVSIQARIWDNIKSEEEARTASRLARQKRAGTDTKYVIKCVSMVVEETIPAPGPQEQTVAVDAAGPELRTGDRMLFYAVEDQAFFATATITGPATDTVPNGYYLTNEGAVNLRFYPIELDEHIADPSKAVDLDSVELDSLSDYKKRLQKPDAVLQIDEDDFEQVAEVLSEITAEDEDDFDINEEDEEEEDYLD